MPEEAIEGGTPAPVATPVAPVPTPAVVPPAPAQAPSGDDNDRRFKGIQADLAKERQQRQAFQQQVQQHQTELALERKRIQALTGVNPSTPEDTEAAEIRARFGKVFSREQLLEQLGLTEAEINDWRQGAKERASTAEASQHYWGRHAKEMVGSVTKEIQKEFGDLSERQTDTIKKAYVLRAQNDPAFLQRHEDGDPTLAAEFAKEWMADWFEPAKRRALATEVGQYRRVPNGQSNGIVNSGEKKIDVTNNDEVMDFISKGRTFEGRRR